jgi:hypothetical protein
MAPTLFYLLSGLPSAHNRAMKRLNLIRRAVNDKKFISDQYPYNGDDKDGADFATAHGYVQFLGDAPVGW